MNDLLELSESIVSFADDTVILINGTNWNESQNKANSILNKSYEWFNDNFLSLNIKKSCYITFALSHKMLPDDFDIKITDENTIVTLDRVENTKYLGITIDQHMRRDVHISNLLKRLRFVVFLFHKLKYILNYNQLKIIYYASFHSLMSYGILGWGGAYNNCVNIIQRLQNKLLKI